MRVVIALVLGLIAGSARAQDATGDRLHAFMGTAEYKDLIGKSIAALPPTVFTRCPALVSNGSRVTIARPVTFGPDGAPTAGVWKQGFPVSGCGNDTILNFFAGVGTDGKLHVVAGLPGATHADLLLQRDALTYAKIGAAAAAKDGCKNFDVRNTRFESYGLAKPPTPDPGPEDHLRPWWETWTLIGCGHQFEVPMDFRPDATGTQITQPAGFTVSAAQ